MEAAVIVAPGLSCPTASGVFPDQGSNPCPLHWQVDSKPLDHQGSPDISLTLDVVCQKQHFLELLPSRSLLLNRASASVSPLWGGKPQTSH